MCWVPTQAAVKLRGSDPLLKQQETPDLKQIRCDCVCQ